MVTGGLLKGSVVKFFDSLLPLNDPGSADAWWRNFYQVSFPTLHGMSRHHRPLVRAVCCSDFAEGHWVSQEEANPFLLQVGLLLFGENFPPASDPPAEQVFSLVTASIGLASFALILALVEQVSLRVCAAAASCAAISWVQWR